MNFTVLGPAKRAPAPVPAAPSGFSVVEFGKGDSANGGMATPNDVTVDNPVGVDVRVIGGSKVSTDTSLICVVGLDVPEVDKTYRGDGLFVLAVPAGASNCDIVVTSTGSGTFTVQVYAHASSAASTPTPTTTSPTPTPPPGGKVVDAVTPATITLGSAGGCAGGTLTAAFQVTAAGNVSWAVAGDPSANGPGQVVASAGSGSGPLTVTISVASQKPTFDCSHTVPMSVFNNVYVTFSNGTRIGVTVYWTYTYVE